MIEFEEARDLVKSNTRPLSCETIPLYESLKRVVATDIFSPIDMPPFDQSAMDGYALGSIDRETFELIGEIKAGDSDEGILLQPHQAIRIFTGAIVPKSAVAVVKQEIVHVHDKIIVIQSTITQGENIRKRGEQIEKGGLAMTKNTLLSPGAIGFLAALGLQQVEVFRKPNVVILVTGNELISAGEKLNPGKIYESNSHMLYAALMECGIEPQIIRVPDNFDQTVSVIEKYIDSCDLLIASGGISVGDYDFVGQAMNQIGVECIFHKVKQKPGKPLYFGKYKNTLVFGLPGNPAAALTCFYVYVLNCIHQMTGNPSQGLELRSLRLTSSYQKTTSLCHFLKARAQNDLVTILHAQSSAMLSSLSSANAIIYLPLGQENWSSEDLVDVYMLS